MTARGDGSSPPPQAPATSTPRAVRQAIAAPDAGPLDDAVVPDPEASYERAAQRPPVDDLGRAIVSAQLGRPARGAPAIVHTCGFGLPTVVRVDPRLEDGTPFPTTFWLSCPVMRSRVGRLEADQAMVGLNQRLATEDDLAAEYAAAHDRYVAFRNRLGDPLPGDPGAGGMPGHIKCLHVHAAHHLATGDNPVGAWTVEHATPAPCPAPCVTEADLPDELLHPGEGDRAGGAEATA